MFNYQGITKKSVRGVWTNALNDQLVSYWRLDESSGDRKDAVGSNNLSSVGSPTATHGKIRNGIDCVRSSSQYLTIASNATLQTGDIDFSFAGWFYPRTIDINDNSILAKIIVEQTTNFEYFLEVYGPATYHFRWRVGSGDLDNAETSVALNAWTFFVCWHDSVANTINYQLNNGTVRTLAHSTGTTANSNPFSIGAGVSARYFDGIIDEIGFWKRVLTADERTLLWNNGLGTTRPY